MGDLIKIRDDESEEFCEFQQCISEPLTGSFLLSTKLVEGEPGSIP